jgi:hypothetical protein
MHRYHQVRESELMDARLSGQTVQRLAFETEQRAGRLACVHRIHHQ